MFRDATLARRAFFTSLALLASLLAVAAPASGAIVINEVESDGPTDQDDFVELFNDGPTDVAIGGYVIRDSNNNNEYLIPPTNLPASGYYVALVNTGGSAFGLSSSDQARLFTDNTLGSQIDSYTWTSHAITTYGRCPNGTGPFIVTASVTSGAVNDCTPPVPPVAWPGGSAISFADGENIFGGSDVSGLAYQPSGSGARGVLWAVKNNPSTLYRLVHNGTTWALDTANGWSAGKSLRYPTGLGNPDAEGVTIAGGDTNGVYVATERDGSGGTRPAVLRFDVSSAATTLNATRDWQLTDLTGLGANAGPETVTWVPDEFLVSMGFYDEAATATYNPASHPNHGAGLFFVGVEQNGAVIAYALDQTTDTSTRIATIASGFPRVMALDFETESGHLWAVCDNDCDGQSKTLDIAQTGPSDGRFVVTNTYARPGGMANLNNEGFAITPQAECVSGLKPVFYADDGNTDQHALRAGTLNCTPLDPDPDPDPTPTPTPSPSPDPTPSPAPQPTATATPSPGPAAPPPAGPSLRDVKKPVLSSVRASRSRVAFRISEAASVRVTIERRSGKRYKRVKAFTVKVAAGVRTIRFKGRVPAARIRRGALRITLVATDAAGNRSATTRKRVGS